MKAATQKGAALLTAMLTVTLVASFAAAALWQQWRSVEIEAAERSRMQMQWVLHGALDWARLILLEDSRTGPVDHLSEPWALALQEARLSSFLALDRSHSDDAMEAFLSGQISDQQALLNVRNLVQNGKPDLASVQAFARLFDLAKLPQAQLQLLVNNLVASDAASQPPKQEAVTHASLEAPLQPYRMEQLVWLGLPRSTVQALMPYATLLPIPTPLNLNTAAAEVLHAAIPGLDLSGARQMEAERATVYYKTLAQALQSAGLQPAAASTSDSARFSVGSRFFAVRGRLRLGDNAVQELSLVERTSGAVRVIWRQREALTALASASLQ